MEIIYIYIYIYIWVREKSYSETNRARERDKATKSVVQTARKERTEGKEGRKLFYLTTHSTHFIYGYMVSDIL